MQDDLAAVTGVILAGGFGTRLRSAVADRPKVLAPVHGRPYLTYLLDQLASIGVRQVVLLTGYRGEQVQATLGDRYRGMRLVYSPEPMPLGTAGAVRHALPLLGSSAVLLMNGDSYCDLDWPAFWDAHRRQGADVTLALVEVPNTSRFGQVHLDARGRVVRFEEKGATGGRGWINAGIYLLDRNLIEEVPSGQPVSLERDMFPRWLVTKCLQGFQEGRRFLDIGTPESYAEAALFFASSKAG